MKRIVALKGGLGNQMFQYSLYHKLKTDGFESYLDLSWYEYNALQNKFELTKIFDLNDIDYSNQDIYNPRIRSFKVRNVLYGKILRNGDYLVDRHDYEKNLKILVENNDLFCDGYWQSSKYFDAVKESIRQNFSFRDIDTRNEDYSAHLDSIDSISIHVRRGDYLSHRLYRGCCTEEYYRLAINKIRERIRDPTFIVFSDDIPWCKSTLGKGQDFEYIDWNAGPKSYQDMFLMTRCKHNIIANSSFSWWGAWLNPNREKIVIAPKKWLNSTRIPYGDVVPKEWVTL